MRRRAGIGIGIERRHFLAASAVLLGLPGAYCTRRRPSFTSDPFTLGVASGDPLSDSVVLWTRLAPLSEELSRENVEVSWSIASDEAMRSTVREGVAIASPHGAHSVHVEAEGLESDRWYWYRFRAGDAESEVGRTRTAPADGASVEGVRFAFASCQHYEHGYYTAYRHMAAEELDYVFHLGDYIYESVFGENLVRSHDSGEPETLAEYRDRYALYKSDPDLRAAHAAFPWIVTWDDHEVDNDFAGAISENNDPIDRFLIRRAAAAQAYYEHMPLRRASIPSGPDIRLYRKLPFGDLAQFHVLDTRSYRTDQPCGESRAPLCEGALDPQATILGEDQERWLYDQLDRSTALWNVIPQQVIVGHVDRLPGEGAAFAMDKWSGYDACRRRFMRFLADRAPSNPVVLTGDVHSNWVIDLESEGKTVATELVGTSITSNGDGMDQTASSPAILSENPFVKFFNAQRGYVTCEASRERLEARYRILDYVTREGSPVNTRATFVVENGARGAQEA